MNLLSKLLSNKTTILNVLLVAAGVLGYLAGNEVIAQNPDLVAALVGVGGAVNVAVRFLGGDVKKA